MTSTSSITDLTTAPPPNAKSALLFWASWHEDSSPGGSASNLFQTLASTCSSSSLSFFRVEAEEVTDLSTEYNVTVVPTFVLIDQGNKIFDKIEGMDDVARLTQAVSNLMQQTNISGNETEQQQDEKTNAPTNHVLTEEEKLHKSLKNLVNSSEVMLFMKGTPTNPKCGFSRQAIEMLSSSNITFGSFDILTDDSVRQGLKSYSDWPTYPQLYVKGELVGGLDIMKEMMEEGDGDLSSELDISKDSFTPASTNVMTLEDRLKSLIQRSKVMLFMKGLPSQPKCGFSRQICELLQSEKVSFDAFDILTDEDVRQGLKKFSDWPTFPQLYIDGELVGGLDIVKEMVESGELKEMM